MGTRKQLLFMLVLILILVLMQFQASSLNNDLAQLEQQVNTMETEVDEIIKAQEKIDDQYIEKVMKILDKIEQELE